MDSKPPRPGAGVVSDVGPLTRLQVHALRRIAPPVPLPLQTVYDGKSKLELLLGDEFLSSVRGLTVMDFGCGYGLETIDLAKAGAELAIGLVP